MIKKIFWALKSFFLILHIVRKHLSAAATPPLIEQHLLVSAWGPAPGSGECEAFLSQSVAAFMAKERRRSKEGGPLLCRHSLRLPRKRALRSDKEKKRKSYSRKKTKTAELRKAPNARQLLRDGSAGIILEQAPDDVEAPSIFQKMSLPKRRRKDDKDD